METPQQPHEFEAKVVESLPEKPLKDQDTANITGGLMGSDDDLDDLEVERLR